MLLRHVFLVKSVFPIISNTMCIYFTCLKNNFLFQMENSAYVPNPLPPPALVVFSQAGSLPEALRMQRPFNTQVSLLFIFIWPVLVIFPLQLYF